MIFRPAHQVAEQYCQVAPLARPWRAVKFGHRLRRRLGFCTIAQHRDGVEQLAAMPDDRDAQIVDVLRRQARQDRFVDRVVAERSLVLVEAEASQPTPDVHVGALLGSGIIVE